MKHDAISTKQFKKKKWKNAGNSEKKYSDKSSHTIKEMSE